VTSTPDEVSRPKGLTAAPLSVLLHDTLTLRLRVVDPDPTLRSLRVSWGAQRVTLNGSAPSEVSLLRLPSSPADLRVEPLPLSAPFTPLFLPLFEDRQEFELALLPLTDSAGQVYAKDLDLLTELVRPFDGGIIRRWPRQTLRLALPAPQPEVDYLGTLRNAVAIWNQLLQVERFVLVPRGSEAEVVCEVSEESSLGYTRLVSRDSQRRPLSMLVHLSPRWTPGAERYVQRAWLHELGHVLGLWGHSQDPTHVLYAHFIAVDTPSPQEVKIARWLWSIPSATHLGWYDRPDSNQDGRRVMLVPTPRLIIRPATATAIETVECRPWPPDSSARPKASSGARD
jgi:hypothetical protein